MVTQVVAGVVAEADCAEVGETISPTEAYAVSRVVADVVRQVMRAVVAEVVCGIVAWVISATDCGTMAEAVAVMVTRMKTGRLVLASGSA